MFLKHEKKPNNWGKAVDIFVGVVVGVTNFYSNVYGEKKKEKKGYK